MNEKVKILDIATGTLVPATIRKAKPAELPGIQDGWIFNLNRHARARNTTAWVLTADHTPEEIEGCMLFEWKDKIMAYMSYLEIAPHNKSPHKRYDHVAGCLIAYAFKMSYGAADENYKAMLVFDVKDEDKKRAEKLMALYSQVYSAVRYGTTTTMLIQDRSGDQLVKEFLERK